MDCPISVVKSILILNYHRGGGIANGHRGLTGDSRGRGRGGEG